MKPDHIVPSAAATSLDVARCAGVSKTAVSLVLNNRGDEHGIATVTQSRIRVAADALGYTPNHAARSLRRQRTNIITFLTSDLGNPYFADVMTSAENAARARGYVVNVISARTADAEAEAFERLGGGISDGLMVHGGSIRTSAGIARLRRQGLACVLLQDAGADTKIPCVRVDIAQGGLLATQHLLSLGHRKVAHITDRRLSGKLTNDRLLGYRQALETAGVPFDPDLVIQSGNSFAGGDTAMRTLMKVKNRPTAVFVFNDQMAIGGLHALAALGLRVPEEVAVIGFDGTELGAFTTPELTTIDHPRADLGRWAATSVMDQLAGTPVQTMRTLPVRLVVRASCGSLPKP